MAYVQRARLVSVIASHAVTVIEAPSGYGKTSLAIEAAEGADLDLVRVVGDDARGGLLDELRRAFSLAGLSRADLDDALQPAAAAGALRRLLDDPETPPLLVCIDEAQRVRGEHAELVRELALAWAGPHRLVVAGRRVPVRLASAARLTASDLALSVDEFLAVVERPGWAGDEAVVDLVDRLSGWPAALSLVRPSSGSGMAVGFDVDRSAESVLDDLVDEILRDAAAEVAVLVRQLALLPAFGSPVVDALGGTGAWTAVRDVGLPMVATGDGWFRFSDPVTERLCRRVSMSAEAARRAAGAFVVAGAAPTAVEVLVEGGLASDAADLIGELWLRDLQLFQPAQLRAVESLLEPAAGASRARVMLQRARLAAVTGDISERADLLVAAAQLAECAGERLTVAAVRAEQASDLARTSRPEEALALGEEVLASVGTDQQRIRATCRASLGLAEATRTGGDRRRAGGHLTEAVMLYHGLGAVSEEAGARHWLAYWVQYMEGQPLEAIASMRDALVLLERSNRYRGVLATFVGEMLAAVGDADGAMAALEEAFRIGRSRGDQLTIAYASWEAAEAATVAGDAARVRLHVAELERCSGDWWDHTTGTDMLAEISQMYRRLGDLDGAHHYLELVAGRSEGSVPTRRFAEAAFESEHGNALTGLHTLDEIDATQSLFAVHRPRLLALTAIACQRLDDADGASVRWAAALGEAERLGLPGLLDRVEPTLVARIRGASPGRVERAVKLLGGFDIVVGGQSVDVPTGRGSTLVKALALTERPLTLDEILDLLWPGEDPGVSRRRLRNLLNRIRDEGVEVIVRTSTGLALSPGFRTDVAEFRGAAKLALDRSDADAARQAIALYGGELLPDDRYDDWFALPREELNRLYVALVDRLIIDARRRDDVGAVLALTDRALAAEPYDERRAVVAAEMAWVDGRRVQAQAYARRARTIRADLGLGSTPQIESILDGTQPGG